MISTQGDDRHGLVEGMISQHRDRIRGPLEHELAQIAETAALSGVAYSSGHVQSRLDLLVSKMQQIVQGVLQSFLDVIDDPTEVTVDEIHATMQREVDAISRIAQEDIQKWGARFGPQDWLDRLRARTTRVLLDGRRDIQVALGRLKRAAERQAASTPDNSVPIAPPSYSPPIDAREFGFIQHKQLRDLIERDYLEIQRAFAAECWKSVIILSGGAIEAILTDVLLQHEAAAQAAASASKKSAITNWDLADLINVAVELKKIPSGVSKLAHPVREYRNLVHPGNELRNELKFGAEEAKIAFEVLNMLHRDVSTANSV